jgi:hypothetical protein
MSGSSRGAPCHPLVPGAPRSVLKKIRALDAASTRMSLARPRAAEYARAFQRVNEASRSASEPDWGFRRSLSPMMIFAHIVASRLMRARNAL